MRISAPDEFAVRAFGVLLVRAFELRRWTPVQQQDQQAEMRVVAV